MSFVHINLININESEECVFLQQLTVIQSLVKLSFVLHLVLPQKRARSWAKSFFLRLSCVLRATCPSPRHLCWVSPIIVFRRNWLQKVLISLLIIHLWRIILPKKCSWENLISCSFRLCDQWWIHVLFSLHDICLIKLILIGLISYLIALWRNRRSSLRPISIIFIDIRARWLFTLCKSDHSLRWTCFRFLWAVWWVSVLHGAIAQSLSSLRWIFVCRDA